MKRQITRNLTATPYKELKGTTRAKNRLRHRSHNKLSLLRRPKPSFRRVRGYSEDREMTEIFGAGLTAGLRNHLVEIHCYPIAHPTPFGGIIRDFATPRHQASFPESVTSFALPLPDHCGLTFFGINGNVSHRLFSELMPTWLADPGRIDCEWQLVNGSLTGWMRKQNGADIHGWWCEFTLNGDRRWRNFHTNEVSLTDPTEKPLSRETIEGICSRALANELGQALTVTTWFYVWHPLISLFAIEASEIGLRDEGLIGSFLTLINKDPAPVPVLLATLPKEVLAAEAGVLFPDRCFANSLEMVMAIREKHEQAPCEPGLRKILLLEKLSTEALLTMAEEARYPINLICSRDDLVRHLTWDLLSKIG